MRFYYSTLRSLAFVLSLCLLCPTVWSVPSKRHNNDSMPNHQSDHDSMAQHSEMEGGGKLKMPEFIKKLMRGKQKKKDKKAAQNDARGEQSESESVQNGQNDNSAEIANMLNEMPKRTTSGGTSRNAAENISPLHGSSPNYYNLASGSSHQRTKSTNPNQQPADYESPRKKGRPEASTDRRRTDSNNDVNHSPQAAGERSSRHGVRSRGISRDGTAAPQPPPSPARSDRSTDSDRRPSTSRRNAVGRTTSRRSSAQQDGPGQEPAAESRGAEQRPADRRKSKSELANEFVESSIKMVDSGTKLVRQVASPVLKYIGENLPESERVVELGMSGANIVGEGLHKSGVIATDVGVSLKEICQYAWPTLCQNSQLYLWPAICAVGRNAWPITSSLAKSGYSSALWLKPRVGKVAKPTWRLCRKFARPGYNRLILPLLKKGAKKMADLPEWAESNSEPSEAEDNDTARAEEAGTSAAEHGETSSRFWSWKTGMPKAGENKDKGKSQNTESRTKSEKAQKKEVPKSENGGKEEEKKPKKKGKEKAEIIEEKNGKEKKQKQKEQAKPKKDIFEELNQYETDDEEDKWA